MRCSTVSLASLALLTLSVACQGRGQLVLGFATDLPATGSLDQVTMAVTRRGETIPIISKSWNISGVPARDFRLPGSFNLYGDPGAAPVFDVDVQGLVGGSLVVERVSSLGIVDDSELFIRLALVASCEQLGCPNSLTCIEGQCKTPFVDLRTLPRYDRFLVTNMACDSGTVFTDTSTHETLPVSGGCADNQLCVEGTCLVNPVTLPSLDPEPSSAARASFSVRTNRRGASSWSGRSTRRGSRRPRPCSTMAPRSSSAAPITQRSTAVRCRWPVRPSMIRRRQAIAGSLIRRARSPRTQPRALRAWLILFVGSVGGIPAAFFYDQTRGAFRSAAAPLTARSFHSATLLGNGKVLIFGGASTLSSGGNVLVATAEL